MTFCLSVWECNAVIHVCQTSCATTLHHTNVHLDGQVWGCTLTPFQQEISSFKFNPNIGRSPCLLRCSGTLPGLRTPPACSLECNDEILVVTIRSPSRPCRHEL